MKCQIYFLDKIRKKYFKMLSADTLKKLFFEIIIIKKILFHHGKYFLDLSIITQFG